MKFREFNPPQMFQILTLLVTEECNLRCKYCYIDKNPKRMTFETAKKAIDQFLERPILMNGANIEMFGGEPTLEVELMDQIMKYFESELKRRNHPWQGNWGISMTSNGTLFTEETKKWIEENRCRVYVGISIDGCREAHEYNRQGSFDKIMENFKWWQSLYPHGSVKATLTLDTVPMIFESIKFMLQDLDLMHISMNPTFDETWDESHYQIALQELKKVADFMIENKYYATKTIRNIFNKEFLNKHHEEYALDSNCGTGVTMLACSAGGIYSPCASLFSSGFTMGTVNEGLQIEKLEPFKYCHNYKDEECLQCEVRGSCFRCLGFEYGDTGTLRSRTRNLCWWYKARLEANKYFFRRLSEVDKEATEFLSGDYYQV